MDPTSLPELAKPSRTPGNSQKLRCLEQFYSEKIRQQFLHSVFFVHRWHARILAIIFGVRLDGRLGGWGGNRVMGLVGTAGKDSFKLLFLF